MKSRNIIRAALGGIIGLCALGAIDAYYCIRTERVPQVEAYIRQRRDIITCFDNENILLHTSNARLNYFNYVVNHNSQIALLEKEWESAKHRPANILKDSILIALPDLDGNGNVKPF